MPTARSEKREARCRSVAVLLASCFSLLACGGDGREPLTMYSPHDRPLLATIEAAFEAAHPNIDLRWLDMGSQEILDRLRFENPNPVADVWFGGPTTIFYRGVAEGVLEPSAPTWGSVVDSAGVAPGGHYWPVYRTPAVIAFNSTLVARDTAPRDWDEVLEPRWHDQVIIRDPVASGTMRAIWGLIIQRGLQETGDTAAGMSWLRRLDGNTRTYALNPAILDQKLARGEGSITLWDLPDILIARAKGMPFDYNFPTSGTVVIDDAIGIVRGTKHRAAAERFLEFVGSVEIQILTAERHWRLPARRDLPLDRVPEWVADVERRMVTAPMDWPLLGEQGAAWMRYWDQRVRGTGGGA
jgi:iron(III) transport system substrate-binding protein